MDVLDAAARDALVVRMASHVASAARAVQGVDRVMYLSTAADGLPTDVPLLHEDGDGLNAALTGALAQAAAAGATRVTFIAGDLPLLNATEIALLIAVASDAIAIAPDRHDIGTNAISLPLPDAGAFRFAFGVDSLARHRREAERLGLEAIEVRGQGLARDVDLPEDLADAAKLE